MQGSRRRARTAQLGVAVLVSGLALSACSQASESARSSSAANHPAAAPAKVAASTAAGSTGSAAKSALPSGRSLIYTGEVQLRSAQVDSVVNQVTQLVTSTGGYIDSEVTGNVGNLYLYDLYASRSAAEADDTSAPAQVLPVPAGVGGEAAQLVVRIPTADYNSAYTQLQGYGTVLDQERSSQDVTQQVVDVASRLKTEQASVDRVRTLMNQATDINQVITLEAALTQRETDLETLEAQQQALQQETAMSTITVQVYQKAAARVAPKPHKPKAAGSAVWNALKDGWHGLYLTVRALLIAVAALLPFAVVLVPLGWLLMLLTRRYRRRTAPQAAPVSAAPPADEVP